jgi:hypothetical protein
MQWRLVNIRSQNANWTVQASVTSIASSSKSASPSTVTATITHSPSVTPAPVMSGLTMGAKAGIGIGSAMVVVALFAVLLLWRRFGKSPKDQGSRNSLEANRGAKGDSMVKSDFTIQINPIAELPSPIVTQRGGLTAEAHELHSTSRDKPLHAHRKDGAELHGESARPLSELEGGSLPELRY